MEIGFLGALVKALIAAPAVAVRQEEQDMAPAAGPRPDPPRERRRPPHYRPRPRLVVSIDTAVDHLIQYLNAEGKTGIWSSREIDEHYLACCELLDLEPHEPRFVRECLAGRRLKIGLKRLLTPEYRAIHVRTGKDRLVLYRIPRCRARSSSDPADPDAIPVDPMIVRQPSGGESGSALEIAENASAVRRIA